MIVASVAANHHVAPARAIGHAATAALHDELALEPKPGLVSFANAGSHTDMDAGTFMRSLFALRHYFPQITAAGAAGARFPVLEALGVDAERRMLRATHGINTHRGAIFLLGLLCAGLGRVTASGGTLSAHRVREVIAEDWGGALHARLSRGGDSNGQRAARRHGLRSAGDEAASGFPVLFDTALPALRTPGLTGPAARLQALFHTMAVLDDTTVAHRGGLEGLRYVQRAARGFLDAGGAARPDGVAHARGIHEAFVARRLSPGGAADVLAAACLLDRTCERP